MTLKYFLVIFILVCACASSSTVECLHKDLNVVFITILFIYTLIVDDYPRLIKQIVDEEIIDYGEAILLIFNQAQKSSSVTRLDLLARLLAQICVKKQSLQYVEHHMNLVISEESNSTRKIFLKKCFREISE